MDLKGQSFELELCNINVLYKIINSIKCIKQNHNKITTSSTFSFIENRLIIVNFDQKNSVITSFFAFVRMLKILPKIFYP